jgi:hypothetical protein
LLAATVTTTLQIKTMMTAINKSYTENGFFIKLLNSYRGSNILPLYYLTIFFYAFPFISLALFFIDQITFNKTEMLFWLIFLISLAPCGLIGMLLSIRGLVKAYQRNSRINKLIGFVGLALGLGGTISGILGLMLIYAVVN